MFSPPNILKIDDFDFEREGTAPKPKYMVVILKTSTDTIIAPLTTSQDYIPDNHKGKRCVEDVPSRLHCYCIPTKLKVGKKGFMFPLDTYIQVQGNLMKRSISYLKTKYQAKDKVELLDELTTSEYKKLLQCIAKSQFVPRGIREAIAPVVKKLKRATSR
ncbi:MAG TPA: hypothetical protein PKL56_11520 [Cyclobacteriaceae bacterium]|nr:hypothetical protein [Cyclobacteriaceae bacterium]HMV07422.1 hypothetical protein [Cyclobacteriaceae bacterium]HMV88974.1 hypothetical protein [Cyclobacteriaceae bacterium]HMW99223.1 hypothetical protein [Cyclobacteriaceae bacterium]HMX48988.1 hypothetical protein [Cyclobacteriaceae bacterium]